MLKEKVERRIFILFNLFWVALLLLSYAIPYGDHKISDQTYFIFSVFLISINFGYLNGKIFLKKEGAGIAQENKVFDFDSVLSNKIIIMYLTIIMALYVFYGIRYTTVTNEIGGVEARNLRFFVGPLFPTTIELLIFNYIISPTRFLASLIVALEVYKEKFKIIPTSICLVIIFLSTYIGGGRFEIMYFLLCLLLAFVIKPPCVKFKNDGDITCYPKGFLFRAIIIIAGLAMIIVAAYVTGYRRNQTSFEDFDLFENIGILFEQFTEYTVGSLGAFDVAMDTGIIENRFYLGRASVIGGIEELIQFFLRTIGVNFYSARTEIGVLFNDGVQVGKEKFCKH